MDVFAAGEEIDRLHTSEKLVELLQQKYSFYNSFYIQSVAHLKYNLNLIDLSKNDIILFCGAGHSSAWAHELVS